jgi:hypothetical protein
MNKAKLKTYIDTAKAYRKAEADMEAAAKELTNDLFADRYSGPMIADATGWSKTIVYKVAKGNWLASADYLEAMIGLATGEPVVKQRASRSPQPDFHGA